MKTDFKNLIFVDVEGHGVAPNLNDKEKFEFGAVEFNSKATFHGKGATEKTFKEFRDWLNKVCEGRPIFVSDNPAYDWQFINYYFWACLNENPFGHSARRISDFYAGLVKDWTDTQSWKKFRITEHDHNPVHDALGNVEAFEIIHRIYLNPLSKCLNCGKEMTPIRDPIAKKITGYLWHCDCMPEGVNVSIG